MKYQANPVIVDAWRITTVRVLSPGCVAVTLENWPGVVHCGAELTARFTPGVGDYWVMQADGYCYLNPAAVFERKYSRCTDGPLTPGPFTGGAAESIEVLEMLAADRRQPPVFKRATCRGSYALGSACGHCERCDWERGQRGM